MTRNIISPTHQTPLIVFVSKKNHLYDSPLRRPPAFTNTSGPYWLKCGSPFRPMVGTSVSHALLWRVSMEMSRVLPQKWPCSQNCFDVVWAPLNGTILMGPSIGDVAHSPLVQGRVRCKHRQAVVSTCLVGRVHPVLGSQKIDSPLPTHPIEPHRHHHQPNSKKERSVGGGGGVR